MRQVLSVLASLIVAGSTSAYGLLIPVDRTLPPLAMVSHEVSVAVDEQVAVTKVEQIFRNHTDRSLEATYIFPVPRGTSVRKFTMWVDGREFSGELVEAGKARQIYTDIVRRTLDPGLLESIGNHLFRVRVFPVRARGDLKLSFSYTSLVQRDGAAVEYVYPLKTDLQTARTLEKFSIQATLRSQHPIQSLYSPTHAITVTRPSGREAVARFERGQAALDRDFQLFYTIGDGDVGLTALAHRPSPSDNGYCLMLLSPRFDISTDRSIPRDVVLVLDTSGSMRGVKMDQGRRALRYCLGNLGRRDRFALVQFATTVTRYAGGFIENTPEHLEQARRWVDGLEANGGTAIHDALLAALDMRSAEPGRAFTVVFFTDGQPTIGESDPDRILKAVAARNTSGSRIFTFGVGDDVNAAMLDRLAEESRAVATYVRPAEDIEAKTSGLFAKISHPVLTDLRLTASGGVRLLESYPPQLPDLFHGGQLIVLGRYAGHGHAALTLTGTIGQESRNFVFEADFPERTGAERAFIEQVWARRKVGYLLDQIRVNGEKKELVDEVIALARTYGITTPYTSYLIVPDAPIPMAGRRGADEAGARGVTLATPGAVSTHQIAEFARRMQEKPGDLEVNRARLADEALSRLAGEGKGGAYQAIQTRKEAYDKARQALAARDVNAVQVGKLGVDLSVETNNLRNQERVEQSARRAVGGRICQEIGGVWIDERFEATTPTLVVKAMSDAYFHLLKRQPRLKDVFQLGNNLVWITPSGRALVVDAGEGKDQLGAAEIDVLFTAR